MSVGVISALLIFLLMLGLSIWLGIFGISPMVEMETASWLTFVVIVSTVIAQYNNMKINTMRQMYYLIIQHAAELSAFYQGILARYFLHRGLRARSCMMLTDEAMPSSNMETPPELEAAAGKQENIIIRERKYDGETNIAVDFGPGVGEPALNIIDWTAIIVVDERQFEFDVPSTASDGVVNDGILTIKEQL